ncbi:MAG: PH domain-containing protein [Actinomycetales bacterium]|nr:PH domain-containing protein [Actinomycetales bacterium]
MSDPRETVRFRPTFGRNLTAVVAVLAAAAFVWTVVENPADARYAPVFALVVAAVWALYGRPAVVVSDGGVELVNVLRTVELPWPAIERIDTKYALTLYTPYGAYAAWAAPAPSREVSLRATRSDTRHLPESTYIGGGIRPGDLVGTASGEAAAHIRRRWEELRDAGHLDDPRLERPQPRVRWHVGPALLVLGLAALTLVALALG